MVPYPRIMSLDIDRSRFSVMIEEYRAYTETEEKKMPIDYEDMEQESRLAPWLDDASEEWDEEYEDDGQPSEYDEWQDVHGGDDWDHGQFDAGEVW